jgi:hypothetical protein
MILDQTSMPGHVKLDEYGLHLSYHIWKKLQVEYSIQLHYTYMSVVTHKEIISRDEVYRVFPIEDMDSEGIAMNNMPEIFE